MKYAVPELPGSCRSLEGLLEFIGDKDGRLAWWSTFQKEYAAAKELAAITMTLAEAETARLQAQADRATKTAELKAAREKIAADKAEAKVKQKADRDALAADRARWEEQVAAEAERQREIASRNEADRATLAVRLAETAADRASAAEAKVAAEAVKRELDERWARLEAARAG